MRILIVKTSAIGDVIHTLPVVDDLKRRYPQAQIDWVVEQSCFGFLSAHMGLTRVLLADLKKWRRSPFSATTWREWRQFLNTLQSVHYDLLFDFQGNTKSALITLCAQAEQKIGFGWKCLSEKSNYFVTNKHYFVPRSMPVRQRYLGLMRAFFNDDHCDELSPPSSFQLQPQEQAQLDALIAQPLMSQNRPRLMVAFGSAWKNKQLTDETLLAFLREVQDRYDVRFFFPFGSPQEETMAHRLQDFFPDTSVVIGKLPLKIWRAFMEQLDGVIAMDSAALHLCGTTATPSFSFFGPTTSTIFQPEGQLHHSFQGKCPYGLSFEKQCPKLRTCSTGACLRQASLADILSQFDTWMNKIKVRNRV